jgi:hypothetical protein
MPSSHLDDASTGANYGSEDSTYGSEDSTYGSDDSTYGSDDSTYDSTDINHSSDGSFSESTHDMTSSPGSQSHQRQSSLMNAHQQTSFALGSFLDSTDDAMQARLYLWNDYRRPSEHSTLSLPRPAQPLRPHSELFGIGSWIDELPLDYPMTFSE